MPADLRKKGGEVKKVRLYDYINSMPFIGVRVSRFNLTPFSVLCCLSKLLLKFRITP